MATPQQRFETFCDELDAQIMAKAPILESKGMASLIEDAFKKAKAKHSFMHDYTISHYFRYIIAKQPSSEPDIWRQPAPEPKDFWDAAYQYDPLRRNSAAGSTRLSELTPPSRLGIIPLGMLYGKTKLYLRPELGALPDSDISDGNFRTTLPYALTDSAAIGYPDGHPSHEYTYEEPLKPAYDRKLRRFKSLG